MMLLIPAVPPAQDTASGIMPPQRTSMLQAMRMTSPCYQRFLKGWALWGSDCDFCLWNSVQSLIWHRHFLNPLIREFQQVASDCNLSINDISGARLASWKWTFALCGAQHILLLRTWVILLVRPSRTDQVSSKVAPSVSSEGWHSRESQQAETAAIPARSTWSDLQILKEMSLNWTEAQAGHPANIIPDIPSDHFSYCEWQNLDERSRTCGSQTRLQGEPRSCVFPGLSPGF